MEAEMRSDFNQGTARFDRRSRYRGLLLLLLGFWIGGALVLGAVVAYNFGGMEELFQRNPQLAARAGFDISDVAAKKQSVLWVHSSELNRAFFEAWNRLQLVLGGLALLLAFRAASSRLVLGLLFCAWALVLYLTLAVNPEVVSLGRALDFVPREPPPAGLPAFQRLHGIYFGLQTLQWLCLILASGLLWRSAGRRG